MNIRLDIDPKLSARIDELASRLGTTASDIVRDALENGHSIAWQEEWLRRVEQGARAADAGEFADEAAIASLLEKYR